MPACSANIVESFSLTGQTSAIAQTSLYTFPADGLYRISQYCSIFTFTAGDGVGLYVKWTNLDGTVMTPGSPGCAPNQGLGGQSLVVGAKGGTDLTYQVYTSISAGTTYNIYIVVESLQ